MGFEVVAIAERKDIVLGSCSLVSCPTVSEFQEIASSGGKIELLYQENDLVSLRFTHANACACGAIQMGVSLDGKRLEYWPVYGVDQRPPQPESPMVAAVVISDQQGYFGRACPKCKSYFRTNSPGRATLCPYCGCRANNAAFTTKNQLEFIDKVRESYIAAFQKKESVAIDLDKIANELPANRPAWAYSEESQQNHFVCPNCKTGYDILGEYAGCPTCGKRNSLQVFERSIADVEQRFNKADAELKDRQAREVEWERLSRCISDFEAMARDIQRQLQLLPATPKRKKDIQGISFQNILKANTSVLDWFGFEMLARFPDDDKIFLNRMFNRRHVLTHNGGRIDQEYLDNSDDTTVRLNQTIVVRSNEIRRLIPLLRTIAQNLFQGFESIA